MAEQKLITTADLAKKAGEIIGTSEPIKITQKMINDFAKVTGDNQWIHVDPEKAKKESPFKTTIAHGFLILALIPQFNESIGYKITDVKRKINLGFNRIRFIRPVPASSEIYSVIKLISVTKTENKNYQIQLNHTIKLKKTDKTACQAKMLVLIQTN